MMVVVRDFDICFVACVVWAVVLALRPLCGRGDRQYIKYFARQICQVGIWGMSDSRAVVTHRRVLWDALDQHESHLGSELVFSMCVLRVAH